MSKKIINMPDLTAKNAIDFCYNDYHVEDYDEVVFDHQYLGTVEPFGMLLVGSKIRNLVKKNKNIEFSDINFKEKEYAAHMGFFQSVYQDYGKKPGEAAGSSKYVPITLLKVKELKLESYERKEEVQETIERKSTQLAKVLSQGKKNLQEILAYSIRELIRNIVEHSTSETCWFAGQYWPTKNKVEIALLDEGVGITQALGFNPNLTINDDRDALLLSIEPGISGRVFKHKGKMRGQTNSIWDNSGYGLYVTSKICQEGGNFLICSGCYALAINDKYHRFFETNFKGTAIRMTLNTSRLNKFSTHLINDIVSEGERSARTNADKSVITASKVSRILNILEEDKK
ncbi:hypothetical protein MOC94_20015 [Bacillus haynesii]|uniref:hypothetical protein n=1 Tax=Bacillus haynesii TaxID=1925021 RepID=UPI00227F6879|nr:hypothetical protein [Bacillus haynesii]MCY8045782.1 hypothetical protein [Bacillus haynesii]MCY8080556.1 hypothetical protein [Bacillus haynesii]MCY8385439.1 hypothetical protein [Bacillus haynesii]MCY8590838.1 hypothetical protein [Bacillus haynesii]